MTDIQKNGLNKKNSLAKQKQKQTLKYTNDLYFTFSKYKNKLTN